MLYTLEAKVGAAGWVSTLFYHTVLFYDTPFGGQVACWSGCAGTCLFCSLELLQTDGRARSRSQPVGSAPQQQAAQPPQTP